MRSSLCGCPDIEFFSRVVASIKTMFEYPDGGGRFQVGLAFKFPGRNRFSHVGLRALLYHFIIQLTKAIQNQLIFTSIHSYHLISQS